MVAERVSLTALCRDLGARLVARGLTVTVAESCTGGLVAAALTECPGSSQWFAYGFVTYSPQAKQALLGLSAEAVAPARIVSEATACAMAEAARRRAGADWAIAVTGIAGPQGGRRACPVGTVVIAWGDGRGTEAQTFRFPGDRAHVRASAVEAALQGLRARLMERPG